MIFISQPVFEQQQQQGQQQGGGQNFNIFGHQQFVPESQLVRIYFKNLSMQIAAISAILKMMKISVEKIDIFSSP